MKSQNEIKLWHNDILGKRLVENLKKNHFDAEYFATKEEAAEEIFNRIPIEATVGVAGSWTLKEMNLSEALKNRGNIVYDHSRAGLSKEEVLEIRYKELNSDVLLTSTNAITIDGQLVNKDGAGNRVAAMIFGPKKVIVIVGTNKIADNIEAALERIEMIAAPMNNKRLNIDNPCVKIGQCVDCSSDSRICNITTIIHKKPVSTDISVFVVGEDLGF